MDPCVIQWILHIFIIGAIFVLPRIPILDDPQKGDRVQEDLGRQQTVLDKLITIDYSASLKSISNIY